MIIASLAGGLGNQCFQYAMGRRLALHHGTELLLDTSAYGVNGELRPNELARFVRKYRLHECRIQAAIATPEQTSRLRDDYFSSGTRDRLVRQVRRFWPSFAWKESHVLESGYSFQASALALPDNVYLQGYWQSPKYFQDIAPLIRKELQLADERIVDSAREAVTQLKARHGHVVSLHVRRGDLAHAYEVVRRPVLVHTAPVGTDYITRAMREFPGDTCFFVFSDSPADIDWCRRNIRAARVEFSTASSDLWDFSAMTLCDSHIIANSSFSWWAAWLDEKPGAKIIAPRLWSAPHYPVKMPTDDLLPGGWTVL